MTRIAIVEDEEKYYHILKEYSEIRRRKFRRD